MSWQRLSILAIGPFLILGLTYWFTMPSSAQAVADAAAVARASVVTGEPGARDSIELDTLCRERARELTEQLKSQCQVLIRPPFVLIGDVGETALERQYQETIMPTARALSTMYLDRAPDQPIAILVFGSEESYRMHAELLDGRLQPNYAGYYERSERRIVLNMATGNGTLAHELTHALTHFDFAEMPEWFDEGLASLIEQSEFSDDRLRLFGISNWRLNYLLPAIRRDELRPVESLIAAGKVRPGQEAVDYAHARYLCLYLQQRELLEPFYRKFRANAGRDHAGLWTLRKLLGVETLEEFDREFRQWVLGQKPVPTRTSMSDSSLTQSGDCVIR